MQPTIERKRISRKDIGVGILSIDQYRSGQRLRSNFIIISCKNGILTCDRKLRFTVIITAPHTQLIIMRQNFIV